VTRVGVAIVAAFVALAACSDTEGGRTVPRRSEDTTTTAPAAINRSLPTTVEPAVDLPGYNVYRPADLRALGSPLPVVVWANGGCVRHDATWRTLLDRWAAAGFVVVAITAPPGSEPAIADRTTAADQATAIDWARDQNERAGGSFSGRLDLDRVAAAGNSCGGITSLALAGSDPRVRAVFVLSGSSVGPGAAREQAAAVMDKVTVPVGFAVGGPEDIASSQAVQDFELLRPGVAGYVASRASGAHQIVSTDPAILAEVAEIGVNWLDLVLDGNEAARASLVDAPCRTCAPGTWTVRAKDLDSLAAK
jgi:dienelactone hydrolase